MAPRIHRGVAFGVLTFILWALVGVGLLALVPACPILFAILAAIWATYAGVGVSILVIGRLFETLGLDRD